MEYEAIDGRWTALNYFLSVVGEPLLSSTSHGQKFWGFRVEAAFLITVIFISVLRFWRVA